MAIAIANPEELVRFSNVLQKYLENIDYETSQVLSAFNQLGDTWRDHKATEFDEDLKELVNRLQIFKENTAEKIPHLRRMAEDIETYLSR